MPDETTKAPAAASSRRNDEVVNPSRADSDVCHNADAANPQDWREDARVAGIPIDEIEASLVPMTAPAPDAAPGLGRDNLLVPYCKGGGGVCAPAHDFNVGDRVRFSTFGLWRDGTVTEIRKGLVCIQPDKVIGESWAVQWRNPVVHEVLNVR